MAHGTDAEGPTGLGPITTSVEPLDQLLDAERWRAGPGVAFRIEAEDQPDSLGLDGLDSEVHSPPHSVRQSASARRCLSIAFRCFLHDLPKNGNTLFHFLEIHGSILPCW
jgi:hypothetical protein